MPEGDTIHTLARVLAPELNGQILQEVRLRHPPHPDLRGRRIERVTSLGKHLYLELDDGRAIRNHLGLHGVWHRYGPNETWQKPARQASLVIRLAERLYVCFNAREVEILATQGLRARDQRHRLGPDLTVETPEPERLYQRTLERRAPETLVVDLLLDQRIAAGIGNVYKSEVLFLHACPPRLTLAELNQETLGRLYETAARLLKRNLSGGPRITREAPDGRGHLWVYRRAGRPCLRCGTPILREMLGQPPRSTYWCPGCQGGEPSAR